MGFEIISNTLSRLAIEGFWSTPMGFEITIQRLNKIKDFSFEVPLWDLKYFSKWGRDNPKKVLKYPYGIWNFDLLKSYGVNVSFEVPLWDLKFHIQKLSTLKSQGFEVPLWDLKW